MNYLKEEKIMTTNETEKRIEEKESEIRGLKNLLEQGDFKARKLIAELCGIVREQFPKAEMPVYEKYLEDETKAQQVINLCVKFSFLLPPSFEQGNRNWPPICPF